MSIQRKQSMWEIKNEYQSLLSQLYDYETGEINQEVDAQLTALSSTTEDKCIAVASWIKKMESEKKQLDYMEEELTKRKVAYEKEISKRLDKLKNDMESFGISEVKCPYFTLRIKKNPFSTKVYDESQIPSQYFNEREIIKIERKPSLTAIKEEVLKTGVQIPGAHVQQNTKLEILTDKI